MESKIADLEKGSRSINYEDVEISLKDMTLRLDNLEQICLHETNKTRRDDGKRRVAALRSSYLHVQKALSNYMKRRGLTPSFDAQKAELFHHSTVKDIEMNTDYYSNQYQQSTPSQVEMNTTDSLNRSKRMVNEYLESGRETLSELTNQRDRLKNVHKNVLTILNSLGVSKDVIRAIENRESYDYLLVMFGMIFISLLLLLIYWFR